MFNKTLIIAGRTRTEYVTREVHEHRAPTDESVKLLKEMEEKAADKIVDSVRVGNTTFECVVHTFKDYINDTTELKAIFSLNGKRMTASHTLRNLDKREDQGWIALRDKIAQEIATTVLVEALKAR